MSFYNCPKFPEIKSDNKFYRCNSIQNHPENKYSFELMRGRFLNNIQRLFLKLRYIFWGCHKIKFHLPNERQHFLVRKQFYSPDFSTASTNQFLPCEPRNRHRNHRLLKCFCFYKHTCSADAQKIGAWHDCIVLCLLPSDLIFFHGKTGNQICR